MIGGLVTLVVVLIETLVVVEGTIGDVIGGLLDLVVVLCGLLVVVGAVCDG